jgi:hypothetical protein
LGNPPEREIFAFVLLALRAPQTRLEPGLTRERFSMVRTQGL